MKLSATAFNILGLPRHYHNLNYSDTRLVPTKQKSLEESISKAPASGVLLVSGCSAPIVNQLLNQDRKVVGISFPQTFDEQFNDGDSQYPNSPVVLLYDIGMEAAKNKDYSATIINSILSYYKARETLLILETPLTPSNFQTTYGLSVKNSITIALKEEDAWLN